MSEEIPEGWNEYLMGTICDVVGGGTPDRSNQDYWNGSIPWVSPTEITGLRTRYISKTKEHITEEGLNRSSAKLHPEGTVLMTSRASIGFPAINTIPMATNQGFQSLRCKEKINNEYLYQLILFLHHELERLSAGSTFLEISSANVKKVKLRIPPKPEQHKIASILTSVDEVIEKTESQISKLQDLKKGMMQDLLTKGIGHTEFKDSPVGRIPKAWNLIRLNNLSSGEKNAIVDGPFGSSINTKRDYIDKGIPVIRTVNIRPFSFIVSNLKFISEDTFERVKRSAVYPGDILLSKVGTIGYSCIFPNHLEKAILSTTGSCKITVNKDAINPVYLCYSLNFLKPYMDLIASEGVQPFLNMITIKSFLIRTPPLKEQEEIAEALESISETIKIHEIKLKKNYFIRKSLMQDLLTGKVRVKVN